MINSNLLKGKMVANGYTQAKLAEKMAIETQTLNLKINGKRAFKISEVGKLKDALDLTNDDIDEIFFA